MDGLIYALVHGFVIVAILGGVSAAIFGPQTGAVVASATSLLCAAYYVVVRRREVRFEPHEILGLLHYTEWKDSNQIYDELLELKGLNRPPSGLSRLEARSRYWEMWATLELLVGTEHVERRMVFKEFTHLSGQPEMEIGEYRLSEKGQLEKDQIIARLLAAKRPVGDALPEGA